MIYYSYYESPVGLIRLESDGVNLTGLYFSADENMQCTNLDVFSSVKAWLDSYFAGHDYVPDFPLALHGTLFQIQVWEILKIIPYGETMTYGHIAREMAIRTGKQRMSSQAVGQAVRRNPVSIIVPCHRVVGSDGRLTGYAGGLNKKEKLLRHEGWLK